MPLWGSAIYSPLSGHWLSECCLVLLLCTQGTYHYVVERTPCAVVTEHSALAVCIVLVLAGACLGLAECTYISINNVLLVLLFVLIVTR